MAKNKGDSSILRDFDVLELFLRQSSKDKLRKAAPHIFERMILQFAELNMQKEKSLTLRFSEILHELKPYLEPQVVRDGYFAKKKVLLAAGSIYLEEKISKYQTIHFHFNDKFANPTIQFVNKYFDPNAHLHLVFKQLPDAYAAQEFPSGENVLELDYQMLNPLVLKEKKLIFHSFFVSHNIKLLHTNPSLLQHSYWMIWGGDLYDAPNDEINEFVRKNIYGIGSFCDNKLIEWKYGNNHKFFADNLAVNPIGKEDIYAAMTRVVKNDSVVIQINNSSDRSTLEMLDVLSKFKNENIKIKTVLSYGDTELVKEIIEKGQSLFSEKFFYIVEMLSPGEYMDYLAENDILILYQDRQQGGANCCSSLLAGKKVFIKSDVTTSKWFEDMGIIVFDSREISEMDFAEFTRLDSATIEKNKKLVEEKIYNDEVRASGEFKRIFDDNCFASMSGGE